MRLGKQKVRLSNKVSVINSPSTSSPRKSADARRSKRARTIKPRILDEDPLALPKMKKKKSAKLAVPTKAARKQTVEPVEWEVEKIVAHQGSGKQTLYKIRWKGWSAKDDTWQKASDLHCDKILEAYKKSLLDKKPAASTTPKKGRGRPKASAAKSPSKTKSPRKAGSGAVAKGRVEKRGRPKKSAAAKATKSPRKGKKVGRKPKAEVEWEVEEVVAARTLENGGEEFLIKWRGYSSDENTWEPAENVTNCNRAVERFRMANKLNAKDTEEDGVKPLEEDDKEEVEEEEDAAAAKTNGNGDASEAHGEDEEKQNTRNGDEEEEAEAEDN